MILQRIVRQGRNQHIGQRLVFTENVVLGHVANSDPASERAGTAVRRFHCGQYFQQRRFASPVRPDQPDPFPGPQVKR